LHQIARAGRNILPAGDFQRTALGIGLAPDPFEERPVIAVDPVEGQLVAGCDKRMETCRLKFNNFLNFQGFPDLPNEDWMMAVPKSTSANSGGSLR